MTAELKIAVAGLIATVIVAVFSSWFSYKAGMDQSANEFRREQRIAAYTAFLETDRVFEAAASYQVDVLRTPEGGLPSILSVDPETSIQHAYQDLSGQLVVVELNGTFNSYKGAALLQSARSLTTSLMLEALRKPAGGAVDQELIDQLDASLAEARNRRHEFIDTVREELGFDN